MTYIKLLTALAGLALLTACGGAAAPANTGGDTTDCKANPFHADCLTNNAPALLLRQNMCLTNDAIHSTCDEVIVGVCEANPFQSTACLPDDTYLPLRIAECITGGKADTPNCTIVTNNTAMNTMLIACLENPFDTACESVPDFMSSFTQARTNRASFCDNSDNVANDFCTGDNVRPICRFDPFTAICFTGTTYLSNRVNNCITAGNANSNNNCNTVFTESASNTCLTNPFTDACTSDADFGTYATIARMTRVTFCGTNSSDTICDTLTACQNNPFATECEAYFQTERDNRESFCDMAGNNTNALCMGASLTGVCGSDPFNASCFADATYLPARVNNCITDGNAGETKCDTIFTESASNTCLTNPFTNACKADGAFGTYADMARANRVAFCESGNGELCTALTTCQGNPFHESCGTYFDTAKLEDCAKRTNVAKPACTTSILSNPNAATWAQSFATPLATEGSPNDTVGIDFNNGVFLQGTADGINSGSRPSTTLNFNDAFADGNTTDGLAYFSGSTGIVQYAGILSGTNLGAPVTETTGTAEWSGFIQDTSSYLAPTAFPLTVGFTGTGGTLDAFIPIPLAITTIPVAFTIDGDFDAKGVITGMVFRRVYTDNTDSSTFDEDNRNNSAGKLSGLIGQEGAVGVFVNDPESNGVFSGGFVAKPPRLVVNHADWLGSFSPAPPATRVAANAGTAAFGGFLNLADGVRDISEAGLTALNTNRHLTLDGNNGDGMHGVTYLVGRNDMMRDQAFVAVLPTTNLGAPLTAQPTIGTWPGTYYNSSFSREIPINFDIVFGANTINGTHDATTPFPLITTFTLGFSDTGVITGTVDQGVGNTATVSGLIGTNGLVGVFVDETPSQAASTAVFYGGFIADNPNN